MDTNPATPRRCHVKVDVLPGAVGTIFNNLIKEVETPKMEPTENDYLRISFVCMMEQLPTIVDYIVSDAIQLFIGPYNPEVKHQYEFKPRGSNFTPPAHVPVTKLPPQRRKQAGEYAKVSESGAARAMLRAFENRRTCNKADLQEALISGGYSSGNSGKLCKELVEEGTLDRVGWGLYTMRARLTRLNVDQPTTTSFSEGEKPPE